MGAKLHLGCGTRHLEGYLNIDERPDVNPDLIADITQLGGLGFEPVSEIYACHVLEHLENPAAVLLHWNDTLEYHGILRLSVPDMSAIFSAYHDFGVILPRVAGLIWGRQDYHGNWHRTGWDFETLANLLRECGFFDVRLWEPEETFPPGYHDFSYAVIHSEYGDPISISLNVEAKKI